MVSKKRSQPTKILFRWILVLILTVTFVAGLGLATNASAAPDGKIIYVKKNAVGTNTGTSWTNAYTNLQSALNAAVSGDQIWVAAGVYIPSVQTSPGDPRSVTFKLKQGVAMFGGFAGNEVLRSDRDWLANLSILSGDLSNNDGEKRFNPNNPASDPAFSENSYHVVTASGVTRPTRLDGFIIRNGNAFLSSGDNLLGGGLFVKEEGSVDEGSPELANLTFYNNNAVSGGAHYARKSNSILINCTYIGNYADFGGGLRAFESTSVLTRTLTLANVIFSGNYARSVGGAINNFATNMTILNGTLANNSVNAPGETGETIYNSNGSVLTIKNSILWGSLGVGEKHIVNALSGTSTLGRSLIQNGCAGNDVTTCTIVLQGDPLLIDADGVDDTIGTLDDNLHVQSSSPVVDAGANSSVYNDELDFDGDFIITERLAEDIGGQTRFKDMPATDTGEGFAPLVDMGAFEVQTLTSSGAIYLPLVVK
jgi:hypothetical protein